MFTACLSPCDLKRVNAYQFKDTLDHVKWISWLPAGDYRFRLVCGDSLCIDSIAGGFIRNDAPDLLVRHNGRAVQAVNFGRVPTKPHSC